MLHTGDSGRISIQCNSYFKVCEEHSGPATHESRMTAMLNHEPRARSFPQGKSEMLALRVATRKSRGIRMRVTSGKESLEWLQVFDNESRRGMFAP
jgi:hypothetical protein